ncbi:peptidase S8 [Catenulispora pinisilvae]|uniref:peptidase S8 n=1 Tax=Catenulispora pinisilvae TaxID=2705253 RepID=UPI001890BBFF|nr:peptidase S8 [Catenulispora pinisilvae]
MHSVRSRIRLITTLVAGSTLAAGSLGVASAATASNAPTVPSRPTYTFDSAGTTPFGESWKASDHPVPGGNAAAAASGHEATSMISGSTPIPGSLVAAAKNDATATVNKRLAVANTSGLPDNYGISTSLESWMNSGGVDALGAYSDLASRYGKLPGQGEIITNVCVGDLTDASMAAAGDGYVKTYGPTTIVQNGQRYLDLPSMPLIPTYVSDPAGHLNPLGSTENEDQADGEIMLDFSVMAPLPHQDQRPANTGSGFTDLLGIAPGAQYRLVVPATPSVDQIRVALLAAARQSPRPNVINASLGFGTDSQGFPGRYLEDDPAIQATIAQIVHQYGITVSIAANDGTRLYTPTAVGPDGGSTPTDVAHSAHQASTIDDDSNSTTPSLVQDSGAIAAGGSTTDDTLSAGTAGPATVAETRISGGGDFSSGFGSRIDVSAPSDNIPAFSHTIGKSAQSVDVSLTGGTSASAPEVAAAAAVVDGAAKLTGRTLNPQQIRDLLEHTARKVATPAQIDRTLNVGPQVDLTAAVERLLSARHGDDDNAVVEGTDADSTTAGGTNTDSTGSTDARSGPTKIVRLGVQHHELLGQEGGEFLESTDPTSIDLAGPADVRGANTGEGLVGPLTFAADVVNAGHGSSYRLTVGSQHFDSATPAIRLTPTQLLTAAGLPVVSTTPRTVSVRFDVLSHGRSTASVTQSITLSATDGTYLEAQAPTAPATVNAGQTVTVHYDLTGVRNLKSPTIAVSTVGHWSPVLAPLYANVWTAPLTGASGDITIPASAFTSGGGIYGISIIQNYSEPQYPTYGESTPIRVAGFTADRRPDAPTLAAGGHRDDASAAFGHQVEVKRSTPTFSVHYSVDQVPGAAGAMLEISSGAPTLWNSLNTFTAQNGTARDGDGYDAGSLVYQKLPARSGTVTLDAIKLGLGSSSSYNVRILPVGRDGKAAGQASPSSALVVDDGLPPNGSQAVDFAAKGADSVAVLTNASDPGESVVHYNPANGTYGSVITADATQSGPYAIIGVDDSAHRVVLMHTLNQDSYQLEVRSLADGGLVGTPQVVQNPPGDVIGGRVDATSHQAWVLQWAKPDYHDELLNVDVSTGKPGTPVEPDAAAKAPAHHYDGVDIDPSTGTVQLAYLPNSALCFGSQSNAVINISEATGAVSVGTGFVPACGVGFASAQDGSKATLLNYASFSVNTLSHTTLNQVDEKTLAAGTSSTLRQQQAGPVAVDSAHHLALIAYASPQPLSIFGHPGGIQTDSNARSQIDVVDTDTGKVLKTLSSFEFTQGFGGPLSFTAEPDIQIDPKTRTGYTYGPNWSQIEQFSY